MREWEAGGQDPTEVSKNRNSKKHKKRNLNYELSDPLMEFMASKSVFYFPALLPTCGLAQDCSRSGGQLAEWQSSKTGRYGTWTDAAPNMAYSDNCRRSRQ